jgi:hypothetical protein
MEDYASFETHESYMPEICFNILTGEDQLNNS